MVVLRRIPLSIRHEDRFVARRSAKVKRGVDSTSRSHRISVGVDRDKCGRVPEVDVRTTKRQTSRIGDTGVDPVGVKRAITVGVKNGLQRAGCGIDRDQRSIIGDGKQQVCVDSAGYVLRTERQSLKTGQPKIGRQIADQRSRSV